MKSEGNIENTPLWIDIFSILSKGNSKRQLHISAIIHNEKEDFPVIKILLLENKRDYYRSTGEYSNLTVFMTASDYLYRVIPFRDHLEISLKLTVFFDKDVKGKDKKSEIVRYKALISFDKNSLPTSENISNRERNELNLLPPVTVMFELQDRNEEVLRLKTIDGTFNNVGVEAMLKSSFLDSLSDVKIDGKPVVEVVDVVPPDNKKSLMNLVIPSGTLVRDLPGFLQEKSKGIYKTGLGSFFQRYKNKPTWFVYPLHDKDRFKTDVVKLVIYSIPPEKMPGMNNTYRTEGKVIYVVTTGDRKAADTSKNTDLNQGVGFRMSDPESFMIKPVEITETGINANRRRLNTEIAGRERKDQLNSASYQPLSGNQYSHFSRLASNNFSGMAVVWENSDPSLLYPGMPVKYVHMDRGDYIESKGTLIGCFSVTKLIGNPLEESDHVTSTQLNIFMEPQSRLPNNTKFAKIGERR